MGALANKVLADLGYDNSYRTQGAGQVRAGSVAPSAPQGNNFVGGVLNSIRSGVQAAPGIVGGFLHKSLVEEPTALAKYVIPETQKFFSIPGQALAAYKQYQTDHNLGQLQKTVSRLSMDTVHNGGAFSAVPTMERVQKGLPVGLTAASIALPFLKGGTATAEGANAASNLSFGQKAVNAATKFGSDTVVGNGNFAANFSNPVLNNAAKLGSGLTYNALVTRPTVDSLQQVPHNVMDIAHGKNIAENAVNLAGVGAPALLTGGQKLAKVASKFIGKNIFDTSGVFDNIVLKSGKTVNQELSLLKKEAGAAKDIKISRMSKQTENKLRVIQDLVLQEAKGNAKLAAQNMERYQSEATKFGNQDLPTFLKNFEKLVTARTAVQKIPKEAITVGGKSLSDLGDIGNIAVARFSTQDKANVVKRLTNSADPVAELQAIKNEGLVTNTNLLDQLHEIVTGDAKLIKDRVNKITSVGDQVLVNGKKLDLPNGYIPVFSRNAGVIRKVEDTAGLVQGKDAPLGAVGNVLRKTGLSPEQMTAEDNKFVFNKFRNEFIKRIDGIGGKTGNQIYNNLNELATSKLGVTDIRQLSKRSIADHLNVSVDEAGKILKEAKGSYKVLSLAERGMAGKLMDFNLRVNPLAAPYSKVQSVARYEKNPFFRLQENLETRFGVASMGGKQVKPLSKQYDSTIQKLDKQGVFTSGYGAEGADSFSGSFSGVKAKLSRDQRANIAATIEKFAGGPDKVDSWLTNPKNADLLNDFKTIVQYPDKGFTSSNLAKMMNLVAFPSRYNLKVTQFAVKQFMKQPAPVQIAIVRGLKDFNDFTKTPEGIKWQADNKEALGLLSYFTPIQPITSVFDTLTGKNKSIGEIGMVGGLPFGVLTRILQGQGILKDRVPYVDPKTGKVYSDRIPEDLKARAESLLNSIVDTLYTYPGRMAGMETSKKQTTQSLVDNATFGRLKGGKYSETDRSGDVTPEQQRQINVLRAGASSGTNTISKPLGSLPTTKKPATIIPSPIYKTPKDKKKKVKPIAQPIRSLL